MQKGSILLFVSIFFVLCVLFPTSLDAQTWSALKRLTWNTGNSIAQSIATDPNNTIHISWQDATPGNSEIFYKRSTDGGVSWAAFKRMTWNSGASHQVELITGPSTNVHMVWMDDTTGDYEIYSKRSTNEGANWGALQRQTWNSGASTGPSIAADKYDSNNAVYIVWFDDSSSNNEIYFKRSTNQGATWTFLKRLTYNNGLSRYPDIIVDKFSHIHLVWMDSTPGNDEIFYRKSTNIGSNWGSIKRLTWNLGSSSYPSISADMNNGIHVVWHDTSLGDYEILYKRSTDGGATWGALKRMTWNSGMSANPQITCDLWTGVYLVWQDSSPGNLEIFFRGSANGGGTWSTLTRLTWNSTFSEWPSISMKGTDVHVAWSNFTSSNYEIFYKNRK